MIRDEFKVDDDRALHHGRVTPHDKAAEQAVLGGLLIKPSALDDVRPMIVTDDFFLPVHREIWEAMLRIVDGGGPIDLILLADDLRARGMLARMEAGEEYLLKLYGATPTAENIEHYARKVKAKAVARRFIAQASEAIIAAYLGEVAIKEVLEEHAQVLSRLDSSSDDGTVRVGDVMDQVLKTMEDRAAAPDQFFVRTPLRALNKQIGGYGRERLQVVACRPGGGKTSWAGQVAVTSSIEQGIPNLIVSMEMSTQELIERWISLQTLDPLGVNMIEARRIHSGNLNFEDWKTIDPAAKRLIKPPLFINANRMSMERLEATVRRWAMRVRRGLPLAPDGGPPLINVTIDYLQLIKRTMKRGQNEESVIAEITSACKGLAKDLKCPVTLISQVNRDSQKEKDKEGNPRKLEMRDLKGSGAIEADADVVLLLHHQQERAGQGVRGVPPTFEELRRRQRLDSAIIVGKNRGGATGEIPCVYDRAVMGFYDVPTDPDDLEETRYAG